MVMMPGDDVLTEPAARRIEVFTGSGRRRKWSPEAKARIVAESYALSVGDVADRYGLAKTQLFTWRREVRAKPASPAEPDRLPFAPVIIEPSTPPVAARPKRQRRRARRGGDTISATSSQSRGVMVAGLPVTTERGGTSLVTKAPGITIQSGPTVRPGKMMARCPI